MKTRNEIYQGEGAQLLRFITTYHSMQYEQILRLFSKNRTSIKSLITSLVKQKRIIYDKENGLLCDSQESANNPDYGMIASFWVLLDFKNAIVYHTDGEFPVKLNFFSKDEWYEVLYVPQEQEYLINHVMESQTKSDAKRLVVLETEEQAAKIHITGGIAFCRVDSFTMPGLLPKRKLRTNTAFLHEPLNLALQTYVTEHSIPLYKRCVVCFSQIYDQSLSLQRIRDYDNLEFKQILDTIASYVLVDDTGLFCDSYHTTELGNYDHTVIFVMEPEIFPGWLKDRKASIKTIAEIS